MKICWSRRISTAISSDIWATTIYLEPKTKECLHQEHSLLRLQVPSPISMDTTELEYAPIGAQVGGIIHSRT